MSMDSLFASAKPSNGALAGRVRSLLEALRRNAPVLAPGCGCLLPMTAVSARDFEDALLLHMTERAGVLEPNEGVPPPTNLDDLVHWLEARGAQASTQAFCHALLEEMQRSLLSFSSQCAVHPVREAAS